MFRKFFPFLIILLLPSTFMGGQECFIVKVNGNGIMINNEPVALNDHFSVNDKITISDNRSSVQISLPNSDKLLNISRKILEKANSAETVNQLLAYKANQKPQILKKNSLSTRGQTDPDFGFMIFLGRDPNINYYRMGQSFQEVGYRSHFVVNPNSVTETFKDVNGEIKGNNMVIIYITASAKNVSDGETVFTFGQSQEYPVSSLTDKLQLPDSVKKIIFLDITSEEQKAVDITGFTSLNNSVTVIPSELPAATKFSASERKRLSNAIIESLTLQQDSSISDFLNELNRICSIEYYKTIPESEMENFKINRL